MDWNFFKSMPGFFWFEVAALLAATSYFIFGKKTLLKWFLPFLFFIIVVEITGWYLHKIAHRHNAWIFNFSVPIEYLFYTYIYYKSFLSKKYVTVTRVIGAAYLLHWIVILLTSNLHVFQNQLLVPGNLIGIFCSCVYFFEILKKEQVIDLLKEPMFWITCGVFLFNLGELTYTLFRPILTRNRWDVTLSIFKAINNKLIFWLYGCIAIGLLCSTLPKYNKTFV